MHILIIEDDIQIAELIRDYLEINQFETTLAHDGQVGLDIALQQNIDLAIIDAMLPSRDGFAIIKSIREKKDIPLLLVTAKTSEVDKIRGLGFGADDYITKPFSPNELIARVKSHLNRYQRLTHSTSNRKNTFHYNNLEVRFDERYVAVDGNEITLKNKEFELFAFLIQNPNIIFSKETLFDRIWHSDGFGDISTITVHINRIREKIEPDPSNPIYIETVWGAGYRFIMK
ncbi:MAG: response regulator transcription factor [Culicoidibacterales bacterium]